MLRKARSSSEVKNDAKRSSSAKMCCSDPDTPKEKSGAEYYGEHSTIEVLLALMYFVTIIAVSSKLHVYVFDRIDTSSEPRVKESGHTRETGLPSALQNQCTVWIAPTSLRGVQGYGIFTTRDISWGERILSAHDGVSIPVENYAHGREPHAEERNAWTRVWNNYWWGRGVPDHVAYEYPNGIIDFQIGFGSLPNHHCVLDSLDTKYPVDPYEDSLVNRFKDPETGSFSYNKGREFFVDRRHKAGEEIFLNYGYCDRSKDLPAWTEFSFMSEDFSQAATIVESFINKEGPMSFDSKGKLNNITSAVSELVFQLLPKTKKELENLVDTVYTKEDLKGAIAQNSLHHRTPDWIRSNGICMESIVPGTSTIPHIGQGAFANFPIAKGEIVAAAPLMQIPDKRALHIYDESGNHNGTQLLMNYCFGHSESSLLLCPNTNAVLINHCSTRTRDCGEKGPNAEYQWSSGWDPASDAWRTMSLQEIAKQQGRGLAFEIVATRAIEENEEIFIDYGAEWDKAWSEHVASWKPPPRNDQEHFVTANKANNKNGPILPELVSGDLRKMTDHPHLFTGCQYWWSEQDEQEVYQEAMLDWHGLDDNEILGRYSDDGSWIGNEGYSKHGDRSHWPCSVIKEQSEGKYIVRIHPAPFADNEFLPWHVNSAPRLLYNYPCESIHYFVKQNRIDQHLPGVFRHYIGIRDEMFPQHWKDLAKRNATE